MYLYCLPCKLELNCSSIVSILICLLIGHFWQTETNDVVLLIVSSHQKTLLCVVLKLTYKPHIVSFHWDHFLDPTSAWIPPVSHPRRVFTGRSTAVVASPVSPIVADLYMEEVESRALSSFQGTEPEPLLHIWGAQLDFNSSEASAGFVFTNWPSELYLTFCWRSQSLQQHQMCQAGFWGNVCKMMQQTCWNVPFDGVLALNLSLSETSCSFNEETEQQETQ